MDAPTSVGDFALRVTATDTTGNAVPANIPIHVVPGGNPPVSQMLSDLNGKTFAAGSTLPLVALATDAGGNPPTNVKFYLDGVPVPGVCRATSAASPELRRQDADASPSPRSARSWAGSSAKRC